MRIEPIGERWTIARGSKRISYFCFFVDVRASWTTRKWACAYFWERDKAESTLEELRHRSKMQRKATA